MKSIKAAEKDLLASMIHNILTAIALEGDVQGGIRRSLASLKSGCARDGVSEESTDALILLHEKALGRMFMLSGGEVKAI